MISNELKEELKEKKNLVILSLFTIIVFILTLSHKSIGHSISFVLSLVVIIIIIFKSLKWMIWKFLRPINVDAEKVKKREKLTDKIASILVGSFMILIIFSQIIMFSTRIKRSSSFEINKNDLTNYSIQTSTPSIHSDLNSCESLKARFQSCVSRSYRGL